MIKRNLFTALLVVIVAAAFILLFMAGSAHSSQRNPYKQYLIYEDTNNYPDIAVLRADAPPRAVDHYMHDICAGYGAVVTYDPQTPAGSFGRLFITCSGN